VALLNVLSAYSIANKEVGYCQSMNFIAGFLLMVSGGEEVESFWVLSGLLAQ
jgi:hypothetical protein